LFGEAEENHENLASEMTMFWLILELDIFGIQVRNLTTGVSLISAFLGQSEIIK
jgi:hypothetical protein